MSAGYGPPASGYNAAPYIAPSIPPPQHQQQQQQPPMYQAGPANPNPQPCYNCGSRQHIAQYCPEPRRAVPAGVMNQKARQPKPHNNAATKKSSKPVITRYAPPPGYVPSAVPPHSRPSVNTALAAPYGQPAPYAAQAYSQASSPATPQWQQSPHGYGAAPQWQSPTAGTPTAYSPYQASQPANAPYGHSPVAPYAHQQSPVQHSPAQGFAPQYPVPQPSPARYYPMQQPQAHSPHPGFSPPVPVAPITPYSQSSVQSAYPTSFPQQPASVAYPPYPQPAQPGYPQKPPRPSPVAMSSSPTQNFPAPYNQPSAVSRNNYGHRNPRNKDGRNRRFQPPTPVEAPEVRHPPPVRIFPEPEISNENKSAGSIKKTPPQPVKRPLGILYDPTEEIESCPVASAVEYKERKNLSGTKYVDAEGNSVPVPNEDMDDPVWSSMVEYGSARANLDEISLEVDSNMELTLKELIKRPSVIVTPHDSRSSDNKNASSGHPEGKKRTYDDSFTDKSGHDQDRRPTKKRQQDRNRRFNRNGRGGQGGQGNRFFNRNQGSSASGQHPPAQRQYHPLPPKPVTGPPPGPYSSSHAGPGSHGPVGKVARSNTNGTTSGLQPQVNGRRSASPAREIKQGSRVESAWRQRDYGPAENQPDQTKKHSENADARRHGSAVMGVYSRRW